MPDSCVEQAEVSNTENLSLKSTTELIVKTADPNPEPITAALIKPVNQDVAAEMPAESVTSLTNSDLSKALEFTTKALDETVTITETKTAPSEDIKNSESKIPATTTTDEQDLLSSTSNKISKSVVEIVTKKSDVKPSRRHNSSTSKHKKRKKSHKSDKNGGHRKRSTKKPDKAANSTPPISDMSDSDSSLSSSFLSKSSGSLSPKDRKKSSKSKLCFS